MRRDIRRYGFTGVEMDIHDAAKTGDKVQVQCEIDAANEKLGLYPCYDHSFYLYVGLFYGFQFLGKLEEASFVKAEAKCSFARASSKPPDEVLHTHQTAQDLLISPTPIKPIELFFSLVIAERRKDIGFVKSIGLVVDVQAMVDCASERKEFLDQLVTICKKYEQNLRLQ